jgi:hypothetical protein
MKYLIPLIVPIYLIEVLIVSQSSKQMQVDEEIVSWKEGRLDCSLYDDDLIHFHLMLI